MKRNLTMDKAHIYCVLLSITGSVSTHFTSPNFSGAAGIVSTIAGSMAIIYYIYKFIVWIKENFNK